MNLHVTVCLMLLTLKKTCFGEQQTTNTHVTEGLTTGGPASHGKYTSQYSNNITSVNSEHVGKDHCNMTQSTSVNSTVNCPNNNNRRTVIICLMVVTSLCLICVLLCVVALWIREEIFEDLHPESIKSQYGQEDVTGVDEQAHLRGQTAEEDTNTTSEGAKMAEEVGDKEVDYACINYSLIQNSGGEAQKTQSEETEYAEIQLKRQGEGEEDEGLQSGVDQGVASLLEGVDGGLESQIWVELEDRDRSPGVFL